MISKERSFEMAKRLKALRDEKRLSHVSLSKELIEKYGVSISKDSLINYEISEDNRTRAQNFPNLKMKVENLLALADYYGVSTDYLLCKSDIKSPDINLKGACAYTGLSEKTIQTLSQFSTRFGHNEVDTFLSSSDLLGLHMALRVFVFAIHEASELQKKMDAALRASNIVDTLHDNTDYDEIAKCEKGLRFARYDVIETFASELDEVYNYEKVLKTFNSSMDAIEEVLFGNDDTDGEEAQK